jgi:transcriptional regulator with XRE-family HTH domain
MNTHDGFGKLLRQSREHRRLSQLALATNAEISPKHLSFLETGRAAPSREMVIKLSEELQIPLRQRNALLAAGGYAGIYPERPLNDPRLEAVDGIVRTVLAAHEPNPAMAIDYCWNIVATNRPLRVLIRDASPVLLSPPLNAMRLALHPQGLAPRIVNFHEWRAHAIDMLKRRVDATADPELVALLHEIQSYRYPDTLTAPVTSTLDDVALPIQLATPKGSISFLTTTMIFGRPRDVTVSELAIECLFPRDKASASLLHDLLKDEA